VRAMCAGMLYGVLAGEGAGGELAAADLAGMLPRTRCTRMSMPLEAEPPWRRVGQGVVAWFEGVEPARKKACE